MPANPRSSASLPLLLAAVACSLTGCTGLIGEPGAMAIQPPGPLAGDGGDAGPPPPDPCTTPETTGPETALRRLSHTQVHNTVRDLTSGVLPAATARTVNDRLAAGALGRWPDDARVGVPGATHGGFRRLDQTVQDGHVELSLELATQLADELVADNARVEQVVGRCATDADSANDAGCLADFVRRFGARALRHPLADADVAFYTAAAGGSVRREDLATVIALIVAAPQFFYHVEHGAAAVAGSTYELDAYELAARLSYHFWQTAPDDALVAAAASGELATPDGYARQVRRLFDDPRTTSSLDAFFREYLWLDELGPLDGRVGDPVFDAFAAPVRPTAQLRDEMIAEVLEATRYVTRRGGDFAALFNNRLDFARTPVLAQIYGQPAWDGAGEPAPFADPARVGLLTRAGFLATGSANTRPIMKGYFIRNGLLCDAVGAPPQGASATPIPVTSMRTTRQVVEAITEAPGTVCWGCHRLQLNPLGFATENFDALGRTRTVQPFFDDRGARTGEAPIDTTTTPLVVGGDMRTSQGGGDLTRFMLESGRPHGCFARQYFRFTFARPEATATTDRARDACVLRDLEQNIRAGRPMSEALQRIALRPEFRRRNFEE